MRCRGLSINNETLSRFKSRRTSEASNYFQEASIANESFRPLDKVAESQPHHSDSQSGASNDIITSSSEYPISIVVPTASSLASIAINSENSSTKIPDSTDQPNQSQSNPGNQEILNVLSRNFVLCLIDK